MAQQLQASLTALLAFVGIAVCEISTGSATAQTNEELRCIKSMNRDFKKLTSRIGRELFLCVRDVAKERLPAIPVSECFTLDRKGRIATAVLDNRVNFQAYCVRTPPPYAVTDPNTIVETAESKELALMSLLFGPIDATLAIESVDLRGSRCQQAITKQMNRCQKETLREFNRCKQKGIRQGTIIDAATLWSSCLGADPSGRVARQCDATTGKLRTRIESKCVNQGVDLIQAFPVCAAADPATLASCLEANVACRSCIGLAAVDDLDPLVCDEFDDGVVNASCLHLCGNGVLEAAEGEDCDDGNTVSCDGCSVTCEIEAGLLCGDGILNVACAEECDDGGNVDGDGCSAGCLLEFCGDGILQPGLGETCDDGNTLSCDGCSDTCLSELGLVCGDGILNAACEACDDGNIVSCDGCSAVCLPETGFVCGDGAANPSCGEECDDGANIDEDGCSAACRDEFCGDGVLQPGLGEGCDDENSSPCDGCSPACQIEPGGVCGDGILNPGCEACDDGGTASCDGCSEGCQIETGFVCGDTIVNTACGEECDDGGTVDEDGCSSSCLNEFCGDGVVQGTAGETCDDGNTVSCDGCSDLCQIEPGGACGDGIVNAGCGEQCDDGNTDSCDGCSASCQDEAAFVCGDGVVTNPSCEECDDGNPTPCDGCSAQCEIEQGLVCGDGILNLDCGEACDDGNTSSGDFCTPLCALDPCDPFGSWDSSTFIGIGCGSPSYFVDFDIGGWEFVEAAGSLSASPVSGARVDGMDQILTGPIPMCPGSFDVTTTHEGFCCTTLRLTGDYTGRDSWSGSLTFSTCDSPSCGCSLGVEGACGTCGITSGAASVQAVRVP